MVVNLQQDINFYLNLSHEKNAEKKTTEIILTIFVFIKLKKEYKINSISSKVETAREM